MDVQNIFLILGIVYFTISIIIVFAILWVFIAYYLRFKRQVNRFKDGFDAVSRASGWVGKQSPVLVTFVSAILASALKNIKDRKRKKDL